MGADDLSIEIDCSAGIGDLEAGPDHPIARAFLHTITTGKPGGTWRLIVVTEPTSKLPRLLAVARLSVGDRFLFFPCGDPTIFVDEVARADGRARFDGAVLDHVTLDPERRAGVHRSHVAVRGLPHSASRGISFTTRPPDGYLIPWFSLLLRDLSPFPIMPRRLRITFPPPRRPVDEMFADAIIGDGGVTVGHLPADDPDATFIQIDVWAGRERGWKSRRTTALPWAYVSAVVDRIADDQQTLTVSKGEIPFNDARGLVLHLSRPRGRLDADRLLRPNYDPTKLSA